MKIKLDTPIMDKSGKPASNGTGAATLRDVLRHGLLAITKINDDADDVTTLARYQLSERIRKAGEHINIEASEIVDLRMVLAPASENFIAGQAIELLENGGDPPDEPEDTQ